MSCNEARSRNMLIYMDTTRRGLDTIETWYPIFSANFYDNLAIRHHKAASITIIYIKLKINFVYCNLYLDDFSPDVLGQWRVTFIFSGWTTRPWKPAPWPRGNPTPAATPPSPPSTWTFSTSRKVTYRFVLLKHLKIIVHMNGTYILQQICNFYSPPLQTI